MELGVLGTLQVRQYGLPVAVPGAKPRAILTMLGLHGGSVVSADTLLEVLWGDDPPRTAAKALQTHISSLRRTLGDGFVLTQGNGWTLSTTEIDATRYKAAAKSGRDSFASGDSSQAVARFDEALALWRGIPELPDSARGISEKTRWIEGHAALVEDRADALLATGRAAEIIGELEAAVGDAPLRERRWGQLMLALYRAGRQGEALGAYQRARSLLAEELGVDPGPDLRRLEAAIVAQDEALEVSVSQRLSTVTRAVTFLLTDIEGSTVAWEADADAMAVALARHDEIVEQVVTSGGGRLVKTRGEGDATFSVFDRPSAAAAAAIELQEAIRHEPWALADPMRIRVALHTGEVELRDGDYFGRAVNRAARLRSLADGDQILCSGATAELVIDTLRDDVLLADLGMRQLKNLARPEHVFELRLETADDARGLTGDEPPIARPDLPPVLAGQGPFVGRSDELGQLLSAWQTTLDAGTRAVLIAGEPGVGKTRLAGEWSRQAYQQGAIVLYGRCDEDLGAPYQPFAESLRALVPCLGSKRLRGLRGVESLLPLVPGLTEELPDLAAPARADADTERYALFDAVVALLGVASKSAPVVLILDDLHWAAKPTLLLLRHLLRFGEHARVQIVGTYRSTDLDRSHPLAAMLADLHRDGTSHRLALSGLDENDVTAYVAEAGYDDEDLARALASVTGGNPFFLIEALRHVDESGGRWDPSTLPQGVREAVSRRLSRLPVETNKALAAAAVVGSRFALDLVERVTEQDLIDAFDEASKAGIVIEEPGGYYRFNHALVRQSLLTELASVRRMRLHQRIATTLETEPDPDDELLAELAYHYFECAWAGNAVKAVEYCRRAADQAMARLAYEGAADYYDKALHALDELDDELPDREDLQAELLVARCEALLAAGDVVSARGAVSQLQAAAGDSARLMAWGACFDGELSMLTDPERLDAIEAAAAEAAAKLAALDDAAGEAKAHTVRATCLGRLGRIGDCETALDQALTAARRAHEHRRVNNVLANAPLAALWGPNPVPRAGGRCLDVVRLLRITTGSPVVEATSTRCQGVLDAFRGRAAAGRQLIDSARRSLTELGMRHALLEVEQFAGIVELVADDPAAAEPHLRRACNGFRRMRLDADTAETAALLARACLALDRDAEADELCTESERLAGHALKAAIAWRTVRAQLLARRSDHDEARRVAEEAIALAERTDALVDHGDACLALATVLAAAGDAAGCRAAAEQAVALYERKGAAALAEKAHRLLGAEDATTPAEPEPPVFEPENRCVRTIRLLDDAYDRDDWGSIARLVADIVTAESRRKVVGLGLGDVPYSEWETQAKRFRETLGPVRHRHVVVAVRGERLALTHLEVGTADLSPGAPRDEWLQLYGIDEDGRVALNIWFDTEDMEAAIAELDSRHAGFDKRRLRVPLENTATRLDDQAYALYAENRLDELGALLAEDYVTDDRRQGLRRVSHDRATALANIRAIASLGGRITHTPIALRGDHLCLSRILIEQHKTPSDAFGAETLDVVEIGRNGMVARIVFDPNDFDAAIAELDARYLAREAAPHHDTWSRVAQAYATLQQRELPPTTSNWVNVDHRRLGPVETGFLAAYVRDAQSLRGRIYIEAVHRLSDDGAVISRAIDATSPDGFDAEWGEIDLLTFEGNRISRLEMFDEADLVVALAKFEQLNRTAPQLENAATRVSDRLYAAFAARDWTAMADLLADDFHGYDRRQVIRVDLHGREAVVDSFRAAADFGVPNAVSTVLATRAERLVLMRVQYSAGGEESDAFEVDLTQIVEIDSEERIVGIVTYDNDDIEAAIAELDARYLAGEAAPHARTWSTVAQAYAAFNRHDVAPSTPDWVYVDNRHLLTFKTGDPNGYASAVWNETPDIRSYVQTVHRLTGRGAVVTHVTFGTSQGGFDAEWRMTAVMTVDGDRFTRLELFDDTDLDSALAKFDQLSLPAPPLENAASRALDHYLSHFAARDWDVMAQALAEGFTGDDRRRVVNGGVRHGRDTEIANVKAIAGIGCTNISSTPLAIRGERLVLSSHSFTAPEWPELDTETIDVVEINAENQIVAEIAFDPDDIDAAYEELDARYLAGEAATHGHTWSVIARAYAEFNRSDHDPSSVVNIDHRRVARFAPGDLTPANTKWTPDLRAYMERVHRLSDFGAVVTSRSTGTSPEGFEAEWRQVQLIAVDGDQMSRNEMFDEADLDAAVARFDELNRPAQEFENAASRSEQRFNALFADSRWDEIAALLADDVSVNERRRGIRRESNDRAAEMAEIHVIADLGVKTMTSAPIAIRGERLVLSRARFFGRNERPDAFHTELLRITELSDDGRVTAIVTFDLTDIEDAFAELDARYLAGEAAAHARTWSVITHAYSSANTQKLALSPDCVSIDHRRVRAFEPGEIVEYMNATWKLAPNVDVYIERVHRLSDLGAVITHVAKGTSQHGFEAEWRETVLLTVDGDMINRCELFDEADLGAALTRFDELRHSTPRLENAASLVYERFKACFAARDWDAAAEILAANVYSEDRRRVVNAGQSYGRDALVAEISAIAEVGVTHLRSEVIATRGGRLVLSRVQAAEDSQGPELFIAESLDVIEIDSAEQVVVRVVFDAEDIDAAFAELEARYLAGEAAPYARPWSTIAGSFVAHNRREVPAVTPDVISIDHRRVAAFAPDEGIDYVRAGWDLGQNVDVHIEAVHRVSDDGAVFSWTGRGTSQEGFGAEWRGVELVMVEGELLSRVEVFDETDLGAALGRFDELARLVPSLDNAARRVYDVYQTHYAARSWDALAQILAQDISIDDRRRVVNSGILRGRDTALAAMRETADTGTTEVQSTTVATRGDQLMLTRGRYSGADSASDGYSTDVLCVFEINADHRATAVIVFDPDDFDAALAELDARYLAGDAVPNARTWSIITRGYTAANRGELAATAPDVVNIDHRRLAMIESGNLIPYLRDTFDELAGIRTYIEAVHRLTDLGAVVTHVGAGKSKDGFDAEWRMINVLVVDGDLVIRSEVFDEANLNAALARFDELSPPTAVLQNAASRALAHMWTCIETRDWADAARGIAENFTSHDHRRVVNAGVRRGRDVHIANMQAVAEVGFEHVSSTVIATRGQRLALSRTRSAVRGHPADEIGAEAIMIVEVDTDDRLATNVLFDIDDLDAAFEELDARYLASEAATRAHTWSVVTQAYAAFNRGEMFPTATDWVNVDHRRGAAFAPGQMAAYLQAIWNVTPDESVYIESVQRLSSIGAVVTHAAHWTSQEGFAAEWRVVALLTVEADLITRVEFFDEVDLDAALERFDELNQAVQRLENASTRVAEHYLALFAARDWNAMTALLADGFSSDDRRRVVGVGVRRGRDAEIAEMRAISDLFGTVVTSSVIATRGPRLHLARALFSGDKSSEPFRTEVLSLFEIGADERITATVQFDADDLDGGFAELEARYLAGEAAAYSQAWAAITEMFTAIERGELPATTHDWVHVDHRPTAALETVDATTFLGAVLGQFSSLSIRIETVHRLTELGAVITHFSHGTSQEGFEAEWRMIDLLTVEGGLVNRGEVFDEAELDAALARFDELNRQSARLENAASRVSDRFFAYFRERDWAAMAEVLADGSSVDDRGRDVTNIGLVEDRDTLIATLQAVADAGTNTTSIIAVRGERLALARLQTANRDPRYGDFDSEMLIVVEIGPDERITEQKTFDIDDVDAAFAELDARYLAGEAAAYAEAWSVVVNAYAAINRHDLRAAMRDWTTVDHRAQTNFDAESLTEYIRATWELTPNIKNYVEAVHRLNDRGAVVTHAAYETSPEGFEAEWRMIEFLAFGGDQGNRCELFDESDFDAALALFDERNCRPGPELENAASRVTERFWDKFAQRDWASMAQILTDDSSSEDRRHVVGSGVLRGREADIADLRAIAGVGAQNFTPTFIATRGERLVLGRFRVTGPGQRPEEFYVEMLGVVEINADEQIVARVAFDPDDIDAAFAELDARYLAGEAAAHAQTWSLVAQPFALFNRHVVATTTPDWVNIDHRKGLHFAPGDMISFIRSAWDVAPDIRYRVEAVHRLSKLGGLVTAAGFGASEAGFDAEWREIYLLTFDGDAMNRCELFDVDDIGSALARFDELNRRGPQLDNAVTRLWARLGDAFTRRDEDTYLDLTSPDGAYEDRRRGLRDSQAGAMRRRVVQSLFEFPQSWQLEIEHLAIRGSRLCLSRQTYRDADEPDRPVTLEALVMSEGSNDDRVHSIVLFDSDDMHSAFEELEKRYMAGEAAAHAQTWSAIAEIYSAINRHEFPEFASDWVNVDHRRGTAFAPGDLTAYAHAAWDDSPDATVYVQAVHRLNDVGAVVTYVAHGTTTEGFEAEWREVGLSTVEGQRVNRSELFDEKDLGAALARLDELSRPAPQLENDAIRARRRLAEAINRRDLDGFVALTTPDGRYSDRRKGFRDEGSLRDAARALFETLPPAWRLEIAPVAIRESHLGLTRETYRDISQPDRPITGESLTLIEVGHDLMRHGVRFDPDDIDGAVAELTARWMASDGIEHGEVIEGWGRLVAIANRHDWEAIARHIVGATFVNNRQLATGDHSTAEYMSSIRAIVSLVPDVRFEFAEVLAHSIRGVLSRVILKGTSTREVAFELSIITLAILDGEQVTHLEHFDSGQRDEALARFEELNRPTRQLENAATHVRAQMVTAYNRRDLDGFLALVAAGAHYEDRRKGIRDERPAERDLATALFELSPAEWSSEAEVVAIRGGRLGLTHDTYRDTSYDERPIVVEHLTLTEIGDDGLVTTFMLFDPEDINGAMGELTARWIASGEVAHPEVIEVGCRVAEIFNRHDWDELASRCAGAAYIPHRQLGTPGTTAEEFLESTRVFEQLVPDVRLELAEILSHSATGFAAHVVVRGESNEGLDIEIPFMMLVGVEGNHITHIETFEVDQRNATLARFDELGRPAPRLENAATRVRARAADAYNRRDVEEFLALANGRYEDRRRGLRDEGAGDRKYAQAVLSETPTSWRLEMEPVAIRGDRLALTRETFRDHQEEDRPITVELIVLTELFDDESLAYTVFFDAGDISGATAELTERWIAAGEVDHPHVVKAQCRFVEMANRHDWDEIAELNAEATYVDHRQLARGDVKTLADHLSSIRAMASLVPDLRIELAEILAVSAAGLVTKFVMKGTSTGGGAVELPTVILTLSRNARVTHIEAFDPGQRDLALARFRELNTSS